MPNRVSMTFYKTVAVLPTDMTVAQFNNDLKRTNIDDIVESMQMKHKLVSMRSKMTLIQRSNAIKKILEGLQKETTPLSDYYI
jgi:adenylate kinase family enzyme